MLHSLRRYYQPSQRAWHTSEYGPEQQQSHECSQQKTEPRLSTKTYKLTQLEKRAKLIADWIEEDGNNWWQLSARHKALWAEHNAGDLRRQISELRNQQQPRFHGTAEYMIRS